MRLTRIRNIFYNLLCMDRLTEDFLRFSKSHLCFMIASNIHSVFVNILLLRQANDVNITIYYNMISYVMSGCVMILAGKVAKKISLKTIAGIGIGLYVLAYVIFLVFMSGIHDYYILIACLMGAGSGFYWLTYFSLISLCSTDETRDTSLSFIGVIGSAIALAVPAVAGAVIGAFEGFTGYTLMFGCAFLFSGLSIYLFSKLPKMPPVSGKTKYLQCVRAIIHNPCWRFVTIQVVTRSIRDGVFMFFLNVLLFQYVQSETIVGFNSLWVGFISIFAQSICGKIVRPKNRIRVMMVATTALTIAAGLLYLGLNAVTVLLLSTVNALFVVFLMNPAMSIDFAVIQEMPDGYECRSEYFAIFELCRGVGRALGLVILLCMPMTTIGYVSALLIISVVQYITVFAAKKATVSVEKYKKSSDHSLS